MRFATRCAACGVLTCLQSGSDLQPFVCLGAQTRTDVETPLAHHARTLDAGQLDQLDKRIFSYLDQDGRRPGDTPETRRHLSFRDRDRGGGAHSPRPATDTDTENDPRTAAQRDTDALVDLAQRAVDSGELPPKVANAPKSWSP
ncbi:MAG: hypothetical protein WCC38_08340 [Pseudonocardiaceae bacterium]